MLLLHLSDVHVTDPDSAIAHYADGEQRLRAIVDHLLENVVPLDAVLLTGDLTDHGTPDEYDRLVAQLARLPCPWFALPDNHDRRPEFDDALIAGTAWAPSTDGPCNYTVDVVDRTGPTVQLVMLDSSRPDHHDGRWTEQTLAWLDETLAARPDVRTLVCSHHPPISTGLWHMDYGGARGGEQLAEVIARHPQVDALICGHVHRRMVMRWADTMLCTAPSLTFLTEALLSDDAEDEPMLHDALPELPLYRYIDGRFTVDSLDWHPGRSRIPMSLALGDEWNAYVSAARSGTLPHGATGH